MKKKLGLLLCIVTMVLPGCVQRNLEASTELEVTITQSAETQPTEIETLDEESYIGEYLDYDNNEPNLEIAKGNNRKYIIQIGIFRLTTLSDEIGELTPELILTISKGS